MRTKTLIIIILIIFLNSIFFNVNSVQAAGISDVISGGKGFIQAGSDQEVTIDQSKLKETSNTLYNILLFAGMCVAIVMSGILGIKFMIGSAEEKAEIKDALIPFIIGCIVVFGAFGIWKIFINIGNRL